MKASISWVAMLASAKSAPRRHLRLKIENQTWIKLNLDACTGRKWNTNVRCGWASSQLITSADQCEADHAAHPAIVDAKASQQIHGAVARVLELAPRWPTTRWRPTWYRRLVWRRRLANANAGLLVHTEQRPVGGWAEQQLDDRYGFGGELRITIVHPGVKDGPGEPGAA